MVDPVLAISMPIRLLLGIPLGLKAVIQAILECLGLVVSRLSTNGLLENLTCLILKEDSLEAQDSLRVQDWSGLWSTAIYILLRVELCGAFSMLQDLIGSEQLAKHDFEILSLILM